jgi:hypothetical protein
MFKSFHDVCIYLGTSLVYCGCTWCTGGAAHRRYLLSKCHSVSNITSLGPVTKVRPSRCRLSPNVQRFSSITYRHFCTDCHQIGQQMWLVRAEILLGPHIKCVFGWLGRFSLVRQRLVKTSYTKFQPNRPKVLSLL